MIGPDRRAGEGESLAAAESPTLMPPSVEALDARRRAFADALGRLIADLVWREITAGADAPKTSEPRRRLDVRRT